MNVDAVTILIIMMIIVAATKNFIKKVVNKILTTFFYNISTFCNMSCITNNPRKNIIPSIPATCIPTNIATIVNKGLIPTLADTNLGSSICLSIDNDINTIDIPIQIK